MIKIEKIEPGASATIVRNGQRVTVFEKQLINYQEVETLEVTGGSVVYSINETEVITKSGQPAPAVPQAAKPKVSSKAKTEEVEPAPQEPTAE